jgi:predicted transglutaminase-like cysteine proteinase
MQNLSGVRLLAGLLPPFALVALTAVPLLARDLPRFTTPVEDASPPHPWIEFCKRFSGDCAVRGDEPNQVDLTPETWALLERVNLSVNRRIKEQPDPEHYGREDVWTYPTDGYGDCEDFVLEKRRALIRAGLPAKALLIAVVWTKDNAGHAVLMVRTDQGSYVLDNKRPSISLWSLTEYDYVKRQSEKDPTRWVYIDGDWPKQ